MYLTEDFQQFVGMTVKDPERRTIDTDHIAGDIFSMAMDNRLEVVFKKAGLPAVCEMVKSGTKCVFVDIKEQPSTPEKVGGWKITNIDIG